MVAVYRDGTRQRWHFQALFWKSNGKSSDHMTTDLILMLLSLTFGMLGSAYTSSLIPMFGVAAACLVVPIWQYDIERKVRETEQDTPQLARKKAFRRKAYSAGAVYVATSQSIGWMKIGYTTKSAEQRSKTLNSTMEGGQNDWVIEIFKHHWKAGRLERNVQKKLVNIKVASNRIPERKYKKTGHGSREIFDLDIEAASHALRSESWKIMFKYLLSVPILSTLFPLMILIIMELLKR